MGCICTKPSTADDHPTTQRQKSVSRREFAAPTRAPLLTKEGSSVSADVNDSVQGLLIDRKGSESIGVPVEHVLKNKVKPEDVFNSGPMVRIIPKSREAEQIAAGWPSWLVTGAGEALSGWIPRKADTFEKLQKIGQGTYSNVYKARDLLHQKTVALKKVRFDNLDPESVTFMAREIHILRRLDHPNIIKLEGLITSSASCSLYLIFEYMEHDLTGLASIPGIKFSEPQVKCYMKQILSGLEHCHSHGVLHRDVKGSNLLIDNSGTLKLADFGLATFYDPRQNLPMTSRVVTLWYRPPELLLGARHYSEAVDLWSAGCILGELYTGKPVMPGRTEVEQLHKIFKLCGSPPDDFWIKSKLRHGAAFRPQQPYRSRLAERFKDIPSSALALIETLLSVDPSVRGTAASALQCEFFTTEPLPCDPSSLPKYPPSKEIDAKMREDRIRRREAVESQVKRGGPAKQGSQYNEAALVDKSNADLVASVQMQENKRQYYLTNQNSSRQGTPGSGSSHRPVGRPRNSAATNNEPNKESLDHLSSRRVAYSGPLTQGGPMWSTNAEKKLDEPCMLQRGARPSTSSRNSTATKNWVAQELRRKPGPGPSLNNNSSSNNCNSGSRQISSRFSGLMTTEVTNTGNEDRFYNTHSMIYSNLYDDRALVHARRQAMDSSSKNGVMTREDKIHFSGPLGQTSKNMEEMLRDRDKRIQEAARRARFDKSKQQTKATVSHVLVPSRSVTPADTFQA